MRLLGLCKFGEFVPNVQTFHYFCASVRMRPIGFRLSGKTWTAMAKKEITYTEAMAEIERILARFRSEEMNVDTLAAEVKRATELIALCKERLHKAETDVKKILE